MLRFLGLGLSLFLAAMVSAPAACSKEAYPNRPVRIIVPFGAGSLSDILARIVAEGLSTHWKQQVIIENKPGISGTAFAAKEAPDGYTLMITSNGHTVIGLVNKNLPFDPIKDFTGITRIGTIPMSLIVSPGVPATNLQDIVALANSNPGKLNFSSPGVASTAYIAAALFKQAANIDIVHIPYKSAPDSLTAVLRNDAQLYFAAVNLASEMVESGKVRAIAMATKERVPQMAKVPTFRESGLDFVYDSWFGLMAPAGVKPEILEQINRDTLEVLKSPATVARMNQQAAVVIFDQLGEFDKVIREDTAKMVAIFPSN